MTELLDYGLRFVAVAAFGAALWTLVATDPD